MAHEQFEDAVALYAVDALVPAERQALEAHIREGCEECRTALKEYRGAANLLPYALPAEAAPFDLQSHLMRTFELDRAQSGKSGVGWTSPTSQGDFTRTFLPWRRLIGQPVFALVSILLLLGVGIYALTLRSQLQTEAAQRRQIEMAMQEEGRRLTALQLQATEQERKLNEIRNDFIDKLGTTRDTLVAREAELAQVRDRLVQQEQQASVSKKTSTREDEMAAFLRMPNIQAVSLTGSDEAKSAGGLLLLDPSSKKAFLYVFNMPPLPPGKTYQLWAILDRPVSAATFGTDSGNKSRIMIRRIRDMSQIKNFAVSMEPEGGQLQPTGQIYLSGAL
ncbi:MAG: anti-sigma factor [Nitrospirota bacterium]